MIEENARVLAVEPGFAWVEIGRKRACGTCSLSPNCGTSVVARLFAERVNRLRVADAIGVQSGDRVVIGIAEGALAGAALLAYLLPLMALMLATSVAQSAGAGEGSSALVGILALCTGLWITGRLTGGTAGRARFRPVLLRRADAHAVVGATPGKSTPSP